MNVSQKLNRAQKMFNQKSREERRESARERAAEKAALLEQDVCPVPESCCCSGDMEECCLNKKAGDICGGILGEIERLQRDLNAAAFNGTWVEVLRLRTRIERLDEEFIKAVEEFTAKKNGSE